MALAAVLALAPAGCGVSGTGGGDGDLARRKVRVTTTTNFITDVARVVGGDRVEVTGLMGPGVDPHLYKASAGDVDALRDADVIFYGGLELEGRMADLLAEVGEERPTRAVTDGIPRDQLLASATYKGRHDPHVWFDVTLWKHATRTMADEYKRLDPTNAAGYERRARRYLAELDDLDAYVRRRAAEVPERSRVLVTSHDAFSYFGRRYGFDVVAIQGISTQTEATTADIERVADVIARRRLKAVFVESSVPRQTIDAVLAAAAKRGQRSRVGGLLFSDAAGSPGTPEGTYIGMVRHNVDLIVEGLR
ncbi:MAG: zinc ABC transporter substrate-binding protein [Actinomycetota bacterium]|nr:zinc ABC transporter substrate-binding protein [Actinomycetota bacterium]